ncbi:Ferric reductase, NADH/NADPH oxidase and related proteins [Ceraceosorus bombacis]|uniref:Ferric reductase, NADH/NADPH oxidase and related proteins n=1 Tax=Ceraceosorus bombacis TaxID=401625 RepID=A0A0P1BF90_9BASI|nr:Ferric reductase, NADH/NADPH oxidase and related proteins [Ceraceosorus bombacis]
MGYPWQLDEESLEYIEALTPEEQPLALQANNDFNQQSLLIPSIFVFVILGGFALLVLGAAFLRLLNWSTSGRLYKLAPKFVSKHIVDAPLVSSRHASPVPMTPGFGKSKTAQGKMHPLSIALPLRGQTVILALLVFLNLLGICAFYKTDVNNYYWPGDTFIQSCRYLSDRAGVLSLGQLPLVILLSGRNSPVRALTGQDFTTAMMYHRWVARIVALQAVIHSIGYTVYSLHYGKANLATAFADPYWRWGVVATVFMAVMIFQSIRMLREVCYEAFVLIHIVFGVLTLVGTYYHIALLEASSYKLFIDFIWISTAFWVFDRVVRLLLLVFINIDVTRNSGAFFTRGTISLASGSGDSDEDLLRVRIWPSGPMRKRFAALAPGSDILLHVSLLEPMTSHPFSVIASGTDAKGLYADMLVRVRKGMTQRAQKKLRKLIVSEGPTASFETLMFVEGPYSAKVEISEHDGGALLVAGGVGIAHTLPILCESIKAEAACNGGKTQGDAGESSGAAAQRTVEMRWMCKSAATFDVALPYLEEAVLQLRAARASGTATKRTAFRVHLCRTESSSKEDVSEKDAASIDSPSATDEKAAPTDVPELGKEVPHTQNLSSSAHARFDALKPEIDFRWSVGRTEIGEAISSIKSESHLFASGRNPTFCVAACGPPTLLDDARAAARAADVEYEGAPFAW